MGGCTVGIGLILSLHPGVIRDNLDVFAGPGLIELALTLSVTTVQCRRGINVDGINGPSDCKRTVPRITNVYIGVGSNESKTKVNENAKRPRDVGFCAIWDVRRGLLGNEGAGFTKPPCFYPQPRERVERVSGLILGFVCNGDADRRTRYRRDRYVVGGS